MGEKCDLGQGERLGNFADECDRGGSAEALEQADGADNSEVSGG